MRKNIVAGNWKMNLDLQAGDALFTEISELVKNEKKGSQEVIICAPFIHLGSLGTIADALQFVQLGAQNCHQEESGAYTGEVSVSMIRSTGATHVIVGHSERRAYFGETDELLAKKTDLLIRHSLTPIFCIGETREERESGKFFDIIGAQLSSGLFHLSAADFGKVIIAYEPVWAIGTGLTATPEQAQEVHAFIRSEIDKKYNQEVAENCSILYGGSCNPKNAPELFSQPDIDGGLIGGASLKARDFADIINVFNG